MEIAYAVEAIYFFKFKRLKYIYIVCLQSYFETFRKKTRALELNASALESFLSLLVVVTFG